MTRTLRGPTTVCPHCHAELDAHSALDHDERPDLDHDERPDPESISVCLYCARVSGFNPDMTIRKLTDAEHDEAMAEADVRAAVNVVKRHGPRAPGRHRGGNRGGNRGGT